jgi:hypothetical protein
LAQCAGEGAAAEAAFVVEDRTPTGPLSVIGIGTFAARGISGIASGGTLDDPYVGGCVIAVRRVTSFGPPAAGTTMGTLGPFGRTCCWVAACGDVMPVSVRVATPVFGSTLPCVEAASDPGGGADEEALERATPLIACGASLVGFTAEVGFRAEVGFPADTPALPGAGFADPTSSGIVDAGTHSVIPGRQTSVEGGRTLLASAARSSSVRTSR